MVALFSQIVVFHVKKANHTFGFTNLEGQTKRVKFPNAQREK
jgi:hypothetical protein